MLLLGSLHFMLRAAMTTGAAVAVGGTIAVREKVGRDNFDRSVSFYKVAIPGWCVYKVTDLSTRHVPKKERDARFTSLHNTWAPRALAKILELRGFYIKVSLQPSV